MTIGRHTQDVLKGDFDCMDAASRNDLRSQISGIVSRLERHVDWAWDGRFATALAELPIAKKGEILAILEESLVCQWNSGTVGDAPEIVVHLVKRLGGLMPGQLLFHSDPDSAAFLFCAWWPWGNGQTISIRMAPISRDLPDTDVGDLMDFFWKQCGISPPIEG